MAQRLYGRLHKYRLSQAVTDNLGELSLNYGKMNFNVAAFKTGDELKDRSSFDPNAKFGKIFIQ